MAFFWYGSLNSPHDFLSMIFGFLSKFRIDIGKNIFSKLFFWNTKKSRKNRELFFFVIFHDISRFSMVSLSNLLRETIENLEISWKITKKHNSRFFRDFFVFQKKSFEKIFSPISIRNFPRIPKISLRNSCDEYKNRKIKKSVFSR